MIFTTNIFSVSFSLYLFLYHKHFVHTKYSIMWESKYRIKIVFFSFWIVMLCTTPKNLLASKKFELYELAKNKKWRKKCKNFAARIDNKQSERKKGNSIRVYRVHCYCYYYCFWVLPLLCAVFGDAFLHFHLV